MLVLNLSWGYFNTNIMVLKKNILSGGYIFMLLICLRGEYQGRSQDLEKGGLSKKILENFWLTTPLIVSRYHGQLIIQPRPPPL